MSVTLREEEGVGFIEFDQPDSPVNVLNFETITKLDGLLDEVAQRDDLNALVFVSAKPGIFIAGADIKEIEKITEPADGQKKAEAGQFLINKIEDLSFPTVAVINGAALGGGCELALGCQYRLATFDEKVKIGLPEVNLGFVPGFGGTYRLPRLVGLTEGISMILAGKPVDGQKALRIGLVDRLLPEKGLNNQIHVFVKEVLAGKWKRARFPGTRKKGLPKMLDTSRLGHALIYRQSRKNVMKLTKGFYPAPLKAIDVIKQNFYCERTRGLKIESKAFSELAVTRISKNLVSLFYLSEKYKKLKMDSLGGTTPRSIKKAAVLGAGTMGGGIAQILSYKDIWTRLKDLNFDALALGLQAARKVYGGLVKKRRLSKSVAERKMAQITTTLDYSGFKDVDIVIEAVVENLDVKKKVFQELAPNLKSEAIIASNTSALSVTEMAGVCPHPENVIGFHFFNPVHRMPLVEVITTPMTSNETLLTSLSLVKRLNKTPIVVKDSPGFIVNRILLVYMNEAGRIFEETGDLGRIDRAVTKFGMPMGPFILSDEVGLDVGIKVLNILEDAFGERFKAVDVFNAVYEKKWLGKKTKKGFYIHGKKKTLNPEVKGCLKESPSASLNEDDCLKRLIYLMINEAAMCLDEKIVFEPDAIDVGMIFGTGFPPFRGGLLRYADQVGIAAIVKDLERFADTLKSDRFKPCAYLLKLQSDNKGFYE